MLSLQFFGGGRDAVYAKQLNGRKVLFFRYAPPLTPLDTSPGTKRPTEPYPRAPSYKCSVYYFWWAFLRENEAYLDCCEKGGEGPISETYGKFGDVRGSDDRETFMEWWKRTRELFCEPPEQKIVFYDDPPVDYDAQNRVLISLPVTGDIDRTFSELRAKLAPIYKRARQDLRDAARRRTSLQGEKGERSFAICPVASRPVLTALYDYLRVWQEAKQDPNATYAEIAERSGLLNKVGGRDEEPGRVRERVKSCKSKAATLIANVGLGRFPDFNIWPVAPDTTTDLFEAGNR